MPDAALTVMSFVLSAVAFWVRSASAVNEFVVCAPAKELELCDISCD